MSELIDREALLDECLNHYEVGNIEQNCTMDWICKTVRNFPAASPWHRVEQEPKDEGKYLVSDGRGNYFVAWWGPRLGWCYDPKFFCYWMPIEPPKEESK